jgi:uncharacterized membrane protein
VNAGLEQGAPARGHVMEPVERAVRWILLCGIAVSVALMAAGLVLGVARGAAIPRAVLPLAEIPRGLAALAPAAYLSLGLIVLIGTPFLRVAGSLVVFVRARDRRYVLVTAAVLLVMCASVLLGRA